MGHIIIFIYIAALLLGGGASFLVGRLRRESADVFLGPLFRYTVFFNFVVLTVLSTNYAQTNLVVPYERRTLAVVLWMLANNFGGFIAFAGLLFNFPAVFRGFQGRPLSPILKRILLIAVGVFAAGYIAGFVLYLYRVPEPWLDISRNTFNGLCLIFLWAVALFHRFERSKIPFIIGRPEVRLFTGLYLGGFGLFGVLLLFPSGRTMLFLALWMLGLSTIPLFWLRFAYSKGRRGEALAGTSPASLDKISAEYGLSAREKEILAFLFQGRRNDEIGSALFISVGTVKNHVTSLYKKLGITRRGQLMRFLS